MNKKLLRDGFEYYLEIEAEGGEEYEYQMLLVNHIEYILPVNVMTVNEKRKLIYSASGYKTLDNSLEKMIINGEQILSVMEAVLNGIDCIKRYLLTPNNLVLSSDCLFVEPDYSRIGLIYVPGYNKDIIEQLRNLMESLIGKTDSSDIRSVMLAWRLYTLIKDEHISLREIRKILGSYKEKNNLIPTVMEEPEEQPEYKEVRRNKRGERKPVLQISLPLLLSGIGVLFCMIAEIVILILIYAGGILPWKRNILLITTLLLVICIGIFTACGKREKIRHILNKLQERTKER